MRGSSRYAFTFLLTLLRPLAFSFSIGYYDTILNGGQSPATFLAGKLPGN